MVARILVEGKTADRVAPAARLSFLIDTDAYFRAFADAALLARRSIGILAWDVDSRVRLGMGGWPYEGVPDQLGPFLDHLVRQHPELEVHLLSWAPAAIYAFERELGLRMKLGWGTHERMHFRLDDTHASTACHHQKAVIIDDALAFAGGIDLTSNRWDTAEHRVDEPRRITTRGKPYGPFHDVQVAVSGEVCRALGDVHRQRWKRHTGATLRPPRGPVRELWPQGLPVDACDLDVGVVTTDPVAGARFTEAIHLAAIASAREHIYIENQYLSSRIISEALAARLQERGGPEVIIVAPRRCAGWLEQSTMGVLRAEVLSELSAIDREDRLRAVYPATDGHDIFVHAKALIVDRELAYVGSANLSDRSMGFDTECGVAVEAAGRRDLQRAIGGLRNRLLGEHLGADEERVRRAMEDGATLRELIDQWGVGERGVRPLEDLHGQPTQEWAKSLIPRGRAIVDPPEPVELQHFITDALQGNGNGWSAAARVGAEVEEEELAQEHGGGWRSWLWRLVPFAFFAAIVAGAWELTPLGDLQPEQVQQWLSDWRQRPEAIGVVLGVYAAGALALAPLNLLSVPTILAFGPWLGAAYALLGALLSASLSYAIGRLGGKRIVARLMGQRVQDVASRLTGSGVLAMALVRLVPAAPFPIMNMVFGGMRIRYGVYLVGTLIGLLPGTLAIALLGRGIWTLLLEPSAATVAVLLGLVAVVAVALLALKRAVGQRLQHEEAHAR